MGISGEVVERVVKWDASHTLDMFRIQYWLPVPRRGFSRQTDNERRALFRGGSHIESSAVRLGDFAGDVESHANAAGAIFGRVFRAGAADQRVEDFRQLARWNWGAAVMNIDENVRHFAAE